MWSLKGFIEGVKLFFGVASLFKELWDRYQDYKIDKHYRKKKERIDRLVNDQIKAIEAKDDEKLKEILRKRTNLDS